MMTCDHFCDRTVLHCLYRVGESVELLNNQIYMVVNHSDAGLCGQLHHHSIPKPIVFSGIEQLVKYADYIMKQPGFPESTVTYRKFSNGEAEMKDKPTELVTDYKGKATFVISVLYCQNATWQGTVKWVEGEKEEKFRSLLELIKLMDGIIEEE